MHSAITDETTYTPETQTTAIKEALAEKVGTQKFRIWFKNSTKLTLADGYLKIGVPNLFIANWIENHFLDEINHAVRSVTGTILKITFIIDPELSGQQKRSQLDSQASAVTKMDGSSQSRFHRDQKRIPPGGHRRKKLKLSLETFVVGSSN
jgi:chromosomal replication initiation ATPase DnaA